MFVLLRVVGILVLIVRKVKILHYLGTCSTTYSCSSSCNSTNNSLLLIKEYLRTLVLRYNTVVYLGHKFGQ